MDSSCPAVWNPGSSSSLLRLDRTRLLRSWLRLRVSGAKETVPQPETRSREAWICDKRYIL